MELFADIGRILLYFFLICCILELAVIILDGLLTSNYGYKASDLYSDANLTIPWNFATDKINGGRARVYVKTSGGLTVTFNSPGGTAVDSVGVTPNASGLGKIPVPATPTKDGYTFVGWVVGNPYNSKVWDFNTNVISYDRTMYAK